jgi:hypothetical protein
VLVDASVEEQRELQLMGWPTPTTRVAVLVAKIPLSEVTDLEGGWSWQGTADHDL